MALLPSFTLESARGPRTFPDGVPLVLVVEDEVSQQTRQPAHAVVADRDARFELVAVAEVGRYRRWPARRFVLSAVHETEAAEQTTIWLDWSDAVREALSLRTGETAFVVVEADGLVTFSAQGVLDEAQLRELGAALRAPAQ